MGERSARAWRAPAEGDASDLIREPEHLAYASARALRSAFEQGRVTPREVLDAQLERIDRLDGAVGAITDTLVDDAVRAADEATRRYRDGTARPLEGLTVAAKEEQPIAGEPLTLGTLAVPPVVPDRSHPMIERIVAAGGIVHARTTTPEFCAAGVTLSERWGVTRSPWNRDTSSGGSSGGSGAALAAGFTTLATGSDIAGSIRIPAAFCGVVGYKSPYGRVPGLAPANLDTYCHDGVMARSVDDAALLYDVVSGRHPDDWASVDGELLADAATRPLAGLRVGVCTSPGDYPVTAAVSAGVERAVASVRAAGGETLTVELPWSMTEITEAAFAHYGTIMAPYIRAELGDGYDEAQPYTRDFVETSERMLAKLGAYGPVAAEAELQATLSTIFAEVDVLIVPTVTVAGLDAERIPSTEHVFDGTAHELVHHLQIPLTIPFNLASRSPVFAVPTGHLADGVPTSVQVAGPAYAERVTAAVAGAVERGAGLYRDASTRPGLTARV
ncbi:amidase [Agromyces silvae]|uniref:amidase n=1 Tax=Agromyces silvae TaxID=3388266 RepID=UPI00280BF6F1|nr:amidase [Agromyces protaetiae]